MRFYVVIAIIALAIISPFVNGAISSQYYTQDHIGQYSYGYADPNSQKHESRSADGFTKGAYSYVDGYGHVQSVSYVADPHTGFHVSGTNLPKGPAPLHAVAAPLAYAAYAAPYAHHVPITPLGVPVDTPEVQHAKAQHFAAHAAALSGHHLYKRSLWGHGYAAPWAYGHHVPVIHNGVPVETPEVQHAKAEHFAAHAKALTHAVPHLPIDTPEVQHAKAAHFAAHAAAKVGHPVSVVPHGGYHIPVIHNGVPVDTPEVQHAKAAHFAAVAEASAKAAHAGPDHYAAAHYAPVHHGPIHIPVIHNGVPVEPPEVQHAKAAHFAAVAEAKSRSHDYGHYYDDSQYHHDVNGW